MNVVDRGIRVRRRKALAWIESDDVCLASVARGVVQHHVDDAWFHGTRVFAELSLAFSREVRQLAPDDSGLRSWFLGHVLVELLLDAELAMTRPALVEEYYRAVESIDVQLVADAVSRIAGKDASGLREWIPRFCHERFLSDYGEDAKLCMRLNQLMRRVGLPPLPTAFPTLLPRMREQVKSRWLELLTPPEPRPEASS